MATRGFGIDIGGSGIKGCPVDLSSGTFAGERVRTPTPTPSTPAAVAGVVSTIVQGFGEESGTGAVGVTFPAVIQRGVARTAANVDKAWIGTDVEALLREHLGRPVTVVNDADAAGYAEARFGAAKGVQGTVFMATLGTGIGSALIVDGRLVPNTELGHLEVDGKDAETRAADSAREREDLSWEHWARRLTRYFSAVEQLLWPDLTLLDIRTPVVPAGLRNDGGIIGAALLATERDAALSAR
jgi:polyphosphate glucokinase